MFTKGDTSPFKERENQTFMLGAMQQQLERMNKRLINYSELKLLYDSSLLLLVSHGNFFQELIKDQLSLWYSSLYLRFLAQYNQ